MALPATDAFTDTNGVTLPTHNANWVMNNGAFQIQSNTLQTNSAGAEIAGHWTGDTFADNQYAKLTLASASAAGVIGPAVRCAAGATATYYGVYSGTVGGAGLTQFFKNVAGTWTQFGSNIFGAAVNDIYMIDANGTTLTAYKNGSSIATTTDSAITSGSAGVTGFDSNTTRGDDWEAGNLAAAVVYQPYQMAVHMRMD